MLDLNITLDRANLARFRRLMAVNQTIAAKALTFTAEKAVPYWRAGNSIFHRRNSWLDKGVRLRAATPGHLEAQVGTLDKFFGRHVIGIDEPKQGRLFIPVYGNIADVPTHRRMRAKLRQMGSTKRKPFMIGDLLFRRDTKGKGGLVLLGKVQQGAQIKPTFDALSIVDRAVQHEFVPVYERLLLRWAEQG